MSEMEELKELVAPLRAKRDQLQAEKNQLNEVVARINKQLAQADRILRLVDPQPTAEPKPKTNGGRKFNRTGVAPERMAVLEEVVTELASMREFITQGEARSILGDGWTQSAVSSGFNMLRMEGKIRQAGTRGSVKLYRMVNT